MVKHLLCTPEPCFGEGLALQWAMLLGPAFPGQAGSACGCTDQHGSS